MRVIGTMIAGAALMLGGCGSKGAEGNAAAEAGMTAEAITSNDVTAIDAVTGHAANMAADVDYSNVAIDNVSGKAPARPGTSRTKTAPPAADGSTDPIRAADAEMPTNAE